MIVGALMGFSSKTVARLLKQTIWVFFRSAIPDVSAPSTHLDCV